VPLSAEPSSDAELARLEQRIGTWLADHAAGNPLVAALDKAPGEPRWYLRLHGEAKDVTTIWFTLHQRTLRFETYVIPAPEENHAAFYEHLLRRSASMVGAHFCIGDEDAVFLVGAIGHAEVSPDELDRIIGTVWHYVEQAVPTAIALGFASRLRR
jgi:hypothetical protein